MTTLDLQNAGKVELAFQTTDDLALRYIAPLEPDYTNFILKGGKLDVGSLFCAAFINFLNDVTVSTNNITQLRRLFFKRKSEKQSHTRRFTVEAVPKFTVIGLPEIGSNVAVTVAIKRTTTVYANNKETHSSGYVALNLAVPPEPVLLVCNEQAEEEVIAALAKHMDAMSIMYSYPVDELCNRLNTRLLWKEVAITSSESLKLLTANAAANSIKEETQGFSNHVVEMIASLLGIDRSTYIPPHSFSYVDTYCDSSKTEGDTVATSLTIPISQDWVKKGGFTIPLPYVELNFTCELKLVENNSGKVQYEFTNGPNLCFLGAADIDSTVLLTFRDDKVNKEMESILGALADAIAVNLFKPKSRVAFFKANSHIISALYTNCARNLKFKSVTDTLKDHSVLFETFIRRRFTAPFIRATSLLNPGKTVVLIDEENKVQVPSNIKNILIDRNYAVTRLDNPSAKRVLSYKEITNVSVV